MRAAVSFMLVCALGCGLARRTSVNAVDPELRAKGEMIQVVDGPGPLRLGGWTIQDPRVAEERVDETKLLAAQGEPRPVIQHGLDMSLESPAGHAWVVSCVAQRRQSASADYAALADENRDDVAVVCEARSDGREPWRFSTEAALERNFQGRLKAPPGTEPAQVDVEVLIWIQRWGWLRRHLPDPVAQVRTEGRVVAAMLLGRPEQAWVSRDVSADLGEASVVTMLALRYLPLGI